MLKSNHNNNKRWHNFYFICLEEKKQHEVVPVWCNSKAFVFIISKFGYALSVVENGILTATLNTRVLLR